jgi:hypothetical protein
MPDEARTWDLRINRLSQSFAFQILTPKSVPNCLEFAVRKAIIAMICLGIAERNSEALPARRHGRRPRRPNSDTTRYAPIIAHASGMEQGRKQPAGRAHLVDHCTANPKALLAAAGK